MRDRSLRAPLEGPCTKTGGDLPREAVLPRRELQLEIQTGNPGGDDLVTKPLLLVAIHGSLDHYGAGPKEILEYGRHFSIHIVCSNSREPAYDWPPEITVERVGLHLPYGRRPPWVSAAGWLDYLLFLKTLDNRIARLKPSVVYSYDSRPSLQPA